MKTLEAEVYNLSEFHKFDSAYFGLANNSINNKIYFSLCTHNPLDSAGVFYFDQITEEIKMISSVAEVLSVKTHSNSWGHGKIHTMLSMGKDNKYYFGTHFAYPGFSPQPVQFEGGRIISFDPIKGEFDDHGILIKGEGIVTMKVDPLRMTSYILTSPSNFFIEYNLLMRKITYINQVDPNPGNSICRSLGLDNKGGVYGCCEDYKIFNYNSLSKTLNFPTTNFKAISSRNAEWDNPNKQGANRVGRTMWRCIEFDELSNSFYGINASDSSIFKLDINNYYFEKVAQLDQFSSSSIYPNLSFVVQNGIVYYAPSDGKFDYTLSDGIRNTSSLVRFDYLNKSYEKYKIIGKNREKIYGSSGAVCIKDGRLLLIGAVESKGGQSSLRFEDQYFDLALIKIDTSYLNF